MPPSVDPLATDARPVAEPLDSALGFVGETSLLRLSRLPPAGCAALWLKLECQNPGGSVKDRICLGMIEAAEREGRLIPGTAPRGVIAGADPRRVIVEPTSGNTGIGLAMVCAIKGYRLILTMPDNMSTERQELLRAYGAELVLTPADRLMAGAVERARAIAAETGAFMPQQFENLANPAAHQAGTGPEIAEAFDALGSPPTAFVAGVGTGGTITGVGRALRQRYPELRIVAVEPEVCAVLSSDPPGTAEGITQIQGLGAGFVPPILDRSLLDRVVMVKDADAWAMRAKLARAEGLLAGVSTGANLHAAVQIGLELGPAAHVVTVACDGGERYLSLEEA